MSMGARRQKCRELIRRYYHDVPSREEILDETISGVLRPHHVLLDAGCGSDLPLLKQYEARTALAVGLDLETPRLRPEGRVRVLVSDLGQIPLASNSVDVIISRSVVEHLENPIHVFQELHRVLRSRGKIVFTTPNKYYYSCLIARLVPESAKAYYFRRVFGEDAYDYFPVHYRANTPRAFRRIAGALGFRIHKVEAIRHYPYYFVFSPLLFRLGTLFDRFITRWKLDGLQSNWLVVMEKES